MKESPRRLTSRQRKLASKFISEEMKEKVGGRRKYKRKQAIAIGISRARAATKRNGAKRQHAKRKQRAK